MAADGFFVGQTGAILLCDQSRGRRLRAAAEKIAEPLRVASELMGEGREDVPWAEVAAVLTAGKFCGQASELGVAEEWYARTALEDISGIAPELINDDRLYRRFDHLGRHKDRLCEHLERAVKNICCAEVRRGVKKRKRC
jgi:hypothetical protein